METQIQETIWNEASRAGMRRMKELLKKKGPEIRSYKIEMRSKQRNREEVWKEQATLWSMKSDYRHRHIAYSELRGREREQIERPGEGNSPNEKEILKIKEEILEGLIDTSGLLVK